MKSKKTAAIIQARMGSTRLPGKVMKNLKAKPVLWHVIERVKQAENIDEIIIATTTHERDKIIFEKAKEWGVKAYRGSEEDVLERYYEAANNYETDTIVRITSDDPLVDPFIVDNLIGCFNDKEYSLVTNSSEEKRTFPIGLDVEIFSFNVLKEAYNNAAEKYQREHVTPYIYENFRNDIYIYHNADDYSDFRWTLDTIEDYKFMKEIYNNLYNGKYNFYFKDIISFLKKNPQIRKINEDIKQKSVKDGV